MAEAAVRGGSWWRRHASPLIAGTLLALAVGLMVLWVRAPELYAGSGADANSQATAIATTRAGILVLLAATVAALGAYAALSETRRANLATHEREREAQVTDRYIRAISQLGEGGDGRTDVRLGGIYALQRIAEDSARDLPTVVDVLCAFVRHHGRGPERDNPDAIFKHRPPTDVQAALNVIRRLRERKSEPVFIDLSDAHLEHVELQHADLSGANLSGADMRGAVLIGTVLAEANLIDSDLRYAPLTAAPLYRSDPGIADIPDPNMPGRERICADLSGADLSRANLDHTQLHGVDLSEAKGLAQRQVDEADGSVSTRLPKGLTMPQHWISESTDGDTT